jgi:hypothetical protein
MPAAGLAAIPMADLIDVDETNFRRKLKLKTSAIYFSIYRMVPLSVFTLGKYEWQPMSELGICGRV